MRTYLSTHCPLCVFFCQAMLFVFWFPSDILWFHEKQVGKFLSPLAIPFHLNDDSNILIKVRSMNFNSVVTEGCDCMDLNGLVLLFINMGIL